MNRQLTCASTRQGQTGKFRQSCLGGRALQMIAFVWHHLSDLDSRHRLLYFREGRRGTREFDLRQEDGYI